MSWLDHNESQVTKCGHHIAMRWKASPHTRGPIQALVFSLKPVVSSDRGETGWGKLWRTLCKVCLSPSFTSDFTSITMQDYVPISLIQIDLSILL